MTDTHRVIRIPGVGSAASGELLMLQHGDDRLPFLPKKVLVVRDIPADAVRGKHAHKATCEVVGVLSGACSVDIDDGQTTTTVRLTDPHDFLYLPARAWRTLHSFAPGTALLIVASEEYDEADYVRSYDAFQAMLKDDAAV